MCGGGSSLLAQSVCCWRARVRSFPNAIRSRPFVCVSLQTLAGRERRSVAEHIQCALLFLGTRVIIKRSDGWTMPPPLLQTNLAQQQQRRRTLVAISAAAFIKRENWPGQPRSCCVLSARHNNSVPDIKTTHYPAPQNYPLQCHRQILPPRDAAEICLLYHALARG